MKMCNRLFVNHCFGVFCDAKECGWPRETLMLDDINREFWFHGRYK